MSKKFRHREWTITRRQSRVTGGREHLTGGVVQQLLRAIEAEASKHHVSKAYVVSVRLAKSYGIEIEDEL